MSISILIWKMIFIIYLPPVRTKLVPKLKMLRIYWNLGHLIFQTSRSRLKIIFIKYLSPVSAQIGLKIKSAQKLLKFGTSVFQICWPRFWRKNLFLLNTYHLFGPKWVPKLKVLRIYWHLAHLIFQLCRSRFWCQKWFLLNIYHLLGPSFSQN